MPTKDNLAVYFWSALGAAAAACSFLAFVKVQQQLAVAFQPPRPKSKPLLDFDDDFETDEIDITHDGISH